MAICFNLSFSFVLSVIRSYGSSRYMLLSVLIAGLSVFLWYGQLYNSGVFPAIRSFLHSYGLSVEFSHQSHPKITDALSQHLS